MKVRGHYARIQSNAAFPDSTTRQNPSIVNYCSRLKNTDRHEEKRSDLVMDVMKMKPFTVLPVYALSESHDCLRSQLCLADFQPTEDQKGLRCTQCNKWVHVSCDDVSIKMYNDLSVQFLHWTCRRCIMKLMPFFSKCETKVPRCW